MPSRTGGSLGAGNDDLGVSAVIGVILMVAITVAIAATVYIWAGGFGTDSGGEESASATAQVITNDSTKDWIKVTLSSGDNAPYSYSDEVRVELVKADGSVSNDACSDMQDSNCTSEGGPVANQFSGDWEVGSSLFFPCSGEGDHEVTIAVLDTTILARSVQCRNPA